MLVELDVFSGRENPRWMLDERSAQTVRELASRLMPTTERPEQPGLGYRGFVLANADGEFRVYKGCLIRADAVLADPSFSIERFLAAELPSEFRELRPRILSELEGAT